MTTEQIIVRLRRAARGLRRRATSGQSADFAFADRVYAGICERAAERLEQTLREQPGEAEKDG